MHHALGYQIHVFREFANVVQTKYAQLQMQIIVHLENVNVQQILLAKDRLILVRLENANAGQIKLAQELLIHVLPEFASVVLNQHVLDILILVLKDNANVVLNLLAFLAKFVYNLLALIYAIS
jgi:hypothetical protein